MTICEYDGVELVLGKNWTVTKMERGQYVCRRCASLISQGKLSRSARQFTKDKLPGGKRQVADVSRHDMTRHNIETVGEAKARAIAERRARLAAQMTPEIVASLNRPWSEVGMTLDLTRKSDRELLRLRLQERSRS